MVGAIPSRFAGETLESGVDQNERRLALRQGVLSHRK